MLELSDSPGFERASHHSEADQYMNRRVAIAIDTPTKRGLPNP